MFNETNARARHADLKRYLEGNAFTRGYDVGYSQGKAERTGIQIDELHPSAGGAPADYCLGYDMGYDDGLEGLDGYKRIREREMNEAGALTGAA